MKIVTWNINSVRLRAPLVVKLMREESPDIICLQETKTPDEFFPTEVFEAEGYKYLHFHGMKSYNGVCILSKHPFKTVVLGDFNIAPREHDVWSSKQLQKVVSHTPIEIEKITKMYESLNWEDAIRHFVPDEEKCYSWWSYRNRDWKKSNRGRRLDHIWVTQPLAEKLKSHQILNHYRDIEKPSDHVPVIIELKS